MKNFSLLLGAIAFLVMGTSVATAQGNGATVEKVDGGFAFFNECCDEFVIVEGTLNIVTRKDGGNHINGKMTGTGSNGNVYSGIGIQNVQITDEGGLKTLIQHFRFTSETGCNWTAKVRIHVTVNANGETTAEFEVVEIECDDPEDLS